MTISTLASPSFILQMLISVIVGIICNKCDVLATTEIANTNRINFSSSSTLGSVSFDSSRSSEFIMRATHSRFYKSKHIILAVTPTVNLDRVKNSLDFEVEPVISASFLSSKPTSSPRTVLSSSTLMPSKGSINPTCSPSTTRSPRTTISPPSLQPHTTTVPTLFMTSSKPSSSSRTPLANAGSKTSLTPSIPPSTSTTRFPSPNKPSNLPSMKPPTYPPSTVPVPYPNITYHPQKSILTGTINLYNIFYGSFASATGASTRALVDYFSSHVGNSSWLRSVAKYYQVNADNSLTYASGNATLYHKSVNPNSGLTATKNPVIIDHELEFIQLIINAFNNAVFPIDTNGVYAIIFRGDFLATFSGGWLTNWCGYHNSFYLSDGRIIKYMVMGDPNTAPTDQKLNCEYLTSASVNGNPGADSIASTYGQQLVNIITDWDGAWNRRTDGLEASDACEGQFGVDISKSNWNIMAGDKRFLVQEFWKPGHGCVH